MFRNKCIKTNTINYSLHDTLIIANYQIRGTEAVTTKGREFVSESMV